MTHVPLREPLLEPVRESLRGLYLIADAALLPARDPGDVVEPLLAAGVALVQYRCKPDDAAARSLDQRARRAQARSLQLACARHQAPFIINDDVELAGEIGADGVHLGADDASPADARTRLGRARLIGVSCYASAARAYAAAAANADYVAFGAVFASATKPHATPITPRMLRALAVHAPLPACAIGGIRPDNARTAAGCGVAMIAAASGILQADDPRAAVETYLAALQDAAQEINNNENLRPR